MIRRSVTGIDEPAPDTNGGFGFRERAVTAGSSREGQRLKTGGLHLLVEYRGCDRVLLDDKPFIERIMRRAVAVAGATEVGAIFRNFTPQGVTGVVVVEESHLSIHTWPEYGYAAVDFYTCGECAPERADAYLREQLRCESAEVLVVQRGIEPPRRSLEVVEHRPGDILASARR